MVIKRLGIKGFGRLKECELRLSDGINVIYGENETGKTTIQWFIKGMLYGLEGGRTREEGAKPPVKRFKPWEGSQYGGFLEYVLDDGSLYTVNRDFNRNTVRILDSSFNDITHSFEIGKDKRVKFAEEHLGLDEVCFEKTIFTKQMETRIDSGGKQEIVNRLINAQETGYEDVSFKTAEKALADALKTCVGTDKSTTRPLDRTIERLGRLYEMLEELKSRREKFYEIEACIKKTKMMLIKNKKEIDILNIKGELIKTARELCRLRKTKESNRIISESISRLKNIKRYLGAGIIASCFAAAALAVFERAIGNIIEKLVFAGGLRLPEAAHIFPMLTLALIIPGILLLARRRVNKNQRELEKKIINIDGRMERGKTDIDNARGKLFLLVKRLEEEGELKYSPLDFPPPAKEGGDACGPVERGAGDADSILNEEILNEEILNEDILNEEEKGWMIACERARNEEMSLALKLKEYETVMSSMDYDDDKIIQAAVEEIEELEMKKKKLEGIGYSLNKALEVLQESRLEMQRNFMPLLNERMSYYLDKITSGRYKDIRADDKLIIKIMGPESVDIVTVPQLSSGAADQVYAALRFALADLITSGGEKLPLIMDEMFSQFDDERTRETLRILDKLSGDRQVILFTCKKREVDMVSEICGRANIIELPVA